MRKKFLVEENVNESRIRKILDPILLGIKRTTHKIVYRTNIGILEYITIPLGSSQRKYKDVGIFETLRKIFLWHPDSTDKLEETLRAGGLKIVEIIKDGPRKIELKKQ